MVSQVTVVVLADDNQKLINSFRSIYVKLKVLC